MRDEDIPFGEPWLLDAAELLERGDPGPTPWLVEGLIVDKAITAGVGKWKTTKSYGVLDICIAIATGRDAFGVFAIPEPGPVVFVNEESGEAALWRRLDALCRGRAINPEELRDRLFVAANRRVKLDDEEWQARIIGDGIRLRPRLFVFDPLARMKAAELNESAQNEISVAIEFMRELRDKTGAGVLFIHHTGHTGEHMRGSSDLETIWESRLRWKRDGQASEVTIENEHRDAEGSGPFTYRISWDGLTRSMRFEAVETPFLTFVAAYLREHPEASANEVYNAAEGMSYRPGKQKALEIIREVRGGGSEFGTTPEPPRNHPGTTPEPPLSEQRQGSGSRTPLYEGFGTTLTVDPLEAGSELGTTPSPIIGDEGYLEHLFAALEAGHITEAEWKQGDHAHRFVVARGAA